jgi:hypothetical protein
MSGARSLPIVLAVAAIVALAGCGGSGKHQVTAAELVQKGDAICRTEQTRFGQIQTHPPANASNASDQTKALVDVAQNASSQLGDLEPPTELRARFDAYLSARDRAVDQLKRGRDAAENQDSRAYAAAQTTMVQSAPERLRLARAVGFKVCGTGSTSA